MIEVPVGNKEFRLFFFLRPDGLGQLTDGEVIQAATVVATHSLSGEPIPNFVSQVAVYDGGAVRYRLDPGAAGLVPRDRVVLRFSVETSNGQTLTDALQLRVI